MKIAVLGTDARAVAIGRLLADGGYDVLFADASGQMAADLAALAVDEHTEATTPYAAAAVCDVLVFAGHRVEAEEIVGKIGRIPPETVIVDAMEGPSHAAVSGAQMLARELDSHRVVRVLLVLPKPGANVPICGDDPDAVTLVDEVLRTCGCITTDRGPLANAAEIEAPQPNHAA